MQAAQISYLRGVCGVTRWNGESNERMYERCSMGSHAKGVNCGGKHLEKQCGE